MSALWISHRKTLTIELEIHAHSMVNSPPWPVKISNMIHAKDMAAYGEHSQKGCLPRILQSYHGDIEFSCPIPADTMVSTLSGGLHHIYAQGSGLKGGGRHDHGLAILSLDVAKRTYQNKRSSQS